MVIIILFLIIILTIFVICYRYVTFYQKQWTKSFNDLDDMTKCPNTAAYFSKYQASFNTWPFILAASSMIALVLLVVLTLSPEGPIVPRNIIIIYAILIFASSYAVISKITNCLQNRMCGMNSCISPYFKA